MLVLTEDQASADGIVFLSMRLLITGASGLVGGNLAVAAARRGYDVTGFVGRWSGALLPGITTQRALDMRDVSALVLAVREAAPDVIVNCAAQSEPAKCDDEPVASRELNVQLPRVLAEEAQRRGSRFIHLSSESVFDGSCAPYRVSDPVAPLNLYARQKMESEQAVSALAPRLGVTVRVTLLMGNSPSGRRSVHERMFDDWIAGETLRLHTDEIRQPCLADNLADVLLELAERREFYGVVQWAGAEPLSRYALGLAIVRHFGLSESLLKAAQLRGTLASSTRPADLTVDLAPLRGALCTRCEAIAEQLPRLIVPRHARAWLAEQRVRAS